MATELASGFVNLSVKYAPAMSQIAKDFNGFQATATKSGTQAGKSLTTALVRSSSGAGSQLSKALFQQTASQASSAGKSSGTSFVSGFKSTSTGVGSQLRSLFSGSGSGSGVSIAADSGRKMGGSFATAFKGVLSAAGVAGVIATVVGGFRDVTKAGLDFESSMNALQGVTGATAQQMEAARAKAAELGSDLTLAGTSASDAGSAILELVKGGLTLDQAMQAVRGTLQLATAAQISSGEAAQIQANALNAFQLPASEAARVADLLANAANSSTGELTDYAQALQQAGAVANLFNIPVEDSVTALALFAKAGVQGSDAGTMLKTMLQSLTDQGKPAQGAIEELGLTLYDLQGNFVGLPSLFDQLAQAQGRMSPQAYQAATNVLFGSDAMRASGIAAIFGADGWNQMEESITRTGGAADMAKAQMKGLPGVVEGLKNTWEGFKLALFDVLDGPLQAMGNFMLKLSQGDFSMLPQWMTDGFRQLGDVAKSAMPALQQAWQFLSAEVKEFVNDITPVIREHAPKFIQFLKDMAPVAKSLGAVLGVAFKFLLEVLPPVLGVLSKFQQALWAISGGAVTAVTTAFNAVGTAATWLWQNAIQPAWQGISTAISTAWSVIQTIFNAFRTGISAVGQAFSFVFNDFVLPMWQNFQTLVSGAWSVINPIWEGIKAGFQAVGAIFQSVWSGAISPAWEAIKGGISSGWAAISGVFDSMKAGFQGVADFIKGVWNGISGAVKGALDAVVGVMRGPLHTIGDLLAAVPESIGPIQIPGAGTAHALAQKLQGFRSGGKVTGPGGTDNVLAWLTAGEGVVTKQAMASGGAPLVSALNNGWVPPVDLLRSMLPGFAEGGAVGRLYDVANSLVGKPYVWGGHGPGGADCSGAASVLVNALLGLDPYADRMGTASAKEWLTAKGAVMGNGPAGTLRIGWKNGGPGGGHMAVTLPDGRPAEAGGSHGNFEIGGDAVGADDPQFTEHAYIPYNAVFPDGAASGGAISPLGSMVGGAGGGGIGGGYGVPGSGGGYGGGSGASASQGSGSSNPYTKVMEGIKEILPDFGQLAQIGLDGVKESLLPPGFSDPQEWGITKIASSVLGFVGGLVGGIPGMEGVGKILGGVSSGISGDASGAVNSFMSLLPQPFGDLQVGSPDLQPGDAQPHPGSGGLPGPGNLASAFTPDPAATGQQGPVSVDNSVHVAENGSIGTDPAKVLEATNRQQTAAQTPQLGTRRFI